jgi:hypothetical protein
MEGSLEQHAVGLLVAALAGNDRANNRPRGNYDRAAN